MRKIAFYSILGVVLFVIVYAFNSKVIVNNYQPKELKVYFEVETIEEDIFQLYYREVDGKLNEKNSKKIEVKPLEGIQKLCYIIPDSLNASHFRFDFGNRERESDIKIHAITFSYNGNKETITSNAIPEFFRLNNYTEKKENSFSRKVINGRSAPFLLSIDLQKVLICLKGRPNYSRIALNIFLSAIIALSISIGLLFNAQKRPLQTKRDYFFIIAFVTMLLLPHLDECFNLDNTAISEKRTLQKKPKITFNNYDEYPEEFETYYNDNFGFRKKMVSLGAMLKIKLFNSAPNSNNVIVGNDEWLFYWKGDIIKNSFLNKNPFHALDLGEYGDSFIDTKNFCQEDNILFIATIYPNKHSIYEDKIPDRIKKLKKDTLERIDQYYDFLERNKIISIDHREDLLKNKRKEQLYLKNDSHWNAKGAYFAYKNILNVISEQDTTISLPLNRDRFNLTEIQNYQGGDLLPILGIDNSWGLFRDTYIKHPTPDKHLKTTLDAYGKGTMLIENLKSTNKKTIIFFGDSYSKELMNFMPEHFRKTILIANIRLNVKRIADINPDIVVYGIVERNLENF